MTQRLSRDLEVGGDGVRNPNTRTVTGERDDAQRLV